jgi:uncharacterized protein YndB with AHSA1/START domain
MKKSEFSIFINRPPEEVFDFYANPANNNQWQGTTQSAAWTSEGSPGVGSTYKMLVDNFGRQLESLVEVTDWEPPKRLSTRSANGPVLVEGETVIKTQGEGSLVTYTSKISASGLMKLLEGLLSKPFKKQFEANLASLKSVLENGNR